MTEADIANLRRVIEHQEIYWDLESDT